MNDTNTRTKVDWSARIPLIGMLLFGLTACALAVVDVPVQDWWAKRGPVVPHDTFPADCSLCHTGGDWNTIVEDFEFDHLAETGVELTGAHARAECIRCHNDRGPVQVFASRGCAGCHENVHRGQLGDRCADCHDDDDWRPHESIAEHARTGFPLVGAHAAVACWRCHSAAQEGIFTGASTDCATCHAQDAVTAAAVDHVAQGWTANCDECHAPIAWSRAAFVHDGFPLTGAHGAASCDACHAGAVFAGTPSDCFSCHATDFQSTTEPPHAAAGFSNDCASCHGVTAWQGASFDHSAFALVGAHGAADCSSCHTGGVYSGLPSDCASCHQADFLATTDPNHVTAGFPQSCEDCHTPFTWGSGMFDHDSFPLTGAHSRADCALCHTGGVFAGTPSDCASCHLTDYQNTNDPNHAAAGFPLDCAACHTTFAWMGAQFDHSSFPLTGAHIAADCLQCHAGGVYAGTPSNCAACHLAEYQATNDPDHAAAGFPTACDACHTTNMWNGSNFNHSFPINNGNHSGLDCADCHTTPRTFTAFSCTHCHEHRQSEMDDEHDEVSGYVWSSPACLQCHPDGDD